MKLVRFAACYYVHIGKLLLMKKKHTFRMCNTEESMNKKTNGYNGNNNNNNVFLLLLVVFSSDESFRTAEIE